MKRKLSLFIVVLFGISHSGCATYTPDTTVTIHVVDENSRPISDAQMIMGFGQGAGEKGLTDSNGQFVVRGSVGNASFGGSVEKVGYYPSKGILWQGGWTNKESAEKTEGGYFPIPHPSGSVLLKPPSDFTVVLKRIIDPVPMYHKRVETELPVLGEPLGFDLVVADWVAPYGRGEVADLVVEGEKEIRHEHRYSRDMSLSIRISFSNPQDGIFELLEPERNLMASEQVAPQVAPLSGYDDSIFLKIERTPDSVGGATTETYWDERQHYVFRIRTNLDENGEIVHAVYGHINGPIGIGGTTIETLYLHFSYLLNPDPDPDNRSLEWNGENLFLKGMNSQQLRELDRELRKSVGRNLSRIYPQISPERRPVPVDQ